MPLPALLWALIGSLIALAIHAQQGRAEAVRFWIDDAHFSPAETFFLRTEIHKSQGKLNISGELLTRAALARKGADDDNWDVYFTTRLFCYHTLHRVSWPRRVNCLPGTESVTLKKSLVYSMQAAYGEGAFSLMPRSYLLPEQMDMWHAWVAEAKVPADSTWVLKANVHRGKGVHLHDLATAQKLVQQSVAHHAKGGSTAGAAPPAFVLAQEYVQEQFQVENRPCYVRLWAVITSVDPLRLYMFHGGVVIFGSSEPDAKEATTSSTPTGGASAGNQAQVVNLWQMDRGGSHTWSLSELRQHMMRQAARTRRDGRGQHRGDDAAEGDFVPLDAEQGGRRLRAHREQKHQKVHSTGGVGTLTAQDLWRPAGSLQGTQQGALHHSRQQDASPQERASAAHHHPFLYSHTRSLGQITQGPQDMPQGGHRRRRRRRMGKRRGQGRRRRDRGHSGIGDDEEDGPGQAAEDDAGQMPEEGMRRRRGMAGPRQRFQRMWRSMQRQFGLAVASGLPYMREGERHMDQLSGKAGWASGKWAIQADGSGGLGPLLPTGPSNTTDGDGRGMRQEHRFMQRSAGYEVLGADFLLDSQYQPHLLEINALPSSAPRDPCGTRDECSKAAAHFAADEMRIIAEQDNRRARSAAAAAAAAPAADTPYEARRLLQHSMQGHLEQHGRVEHPSTRAGSGSSHGRSMAADTGQQEQQQKPPGDFLPRGAFDQEKHRLVHDLLGLLGLPKHLEGPTAAMHSPSRRAGTARMGLQGRGLQEVQQSASSTQQASVSTQGAAQGDHGRSLSGSDHEPAQVLEGYGPPSKQEGVGAVLLLAAALIGQYTVTGQEQAHATEIASTLGSRFPSALDAAHRAVPSLHSLMCQGLPALPEAATKLGSAWVAGQAQAGYSELQAAGLQVSPTSVRRQPRSCLYLQEVQVVGELEMEMSARGAFQLLKPLKGLQGAVFRNKAALRDARLQHAGSSSEEAQHSSSSVKGWVSGLLRL